jgi:hypothetical protein
VADRRDVDIISSGRDPDRRRPVPRRLLAVAAAAALIGGTITVHLVLGSNAHRLPHRRTQGALSSTALAAPSMLHGTPLRPGVAPGTFLFLGGQELRLLNVRDGVSASLATALPDAAGARDPLGLDPVVRQITSVAGGVIALLAGDGGSAGLPEVGDVLFVPVTASGAGPPRIIARANYMALAPDHHDIWVEQAGPPWGEGPPASPAWLVDEAGHRLSADVRLHRRVVLAATVRGLLTQGPIGTVALIKPENGSVERTGIPANALIAGADADHVAWQAGTCAVRCPLHVTDIRNGSVRQLSLPPRTVLDPADTSAFDPAGQRLALPLDTINRHGQAAGTYLYVADITDGTLVRLPGAAIPLATLPAVPGAIPAGTTDVVSARWTSAGSGLWIVATDGLFFQVAYWADAGPLQVLPPQAGLAYKFDIPGPVTPGR